MNLDKSIKLMRKYSACEQCGNDRVGGNEGTCTIEDNIFRRTCKCGWSITVDENDRLKIACWAKLGPREVYELHDEDGRFYGYVDVALLREKGIVKRINHTAKANAFINTMDGQQWVRNTRFFSVT